MAFQKTGGIKSVVSWDDVNRMLPTGTDSNSKSKRIQLYSDFDQRDRGLLNQSETVRGLFRLLPSIGGIVDMRPGWAQAFRLTREAVDPVVPIGMDFIDQNQFRVLLICCWYYLKLWECFFRISRSNDVVIRREDVDRVPALFRNAGLQDLVFFQNDLLAAFDRSGQEAMAFKLFADLVLKRALPEMCRIDEAAERGAATRYLERTQPHLVQNNAPVGYKMPARNYQLGQEANKMYDWRPGKTLESPAKSEATAAIPVSAATYGRSGQPSVDQREQKAAQRWNTQYMIDHTSKDWFKRGPSDIGAAGQKALMPSAGAANGHSPGGLPIRMAPTPTAAASRFAAPSPPSVALPSHGTHYSQSSPAIARDASLQARSAMDPMRESVRDMDRNQMRNRLNEQLDMCSTFQMRKFLKAAGSTIVGPAPKATLAM